MKLGCAVLFVAAAAAPRLAAARCGVPRWIGTPPNTVIPSHGSLYVYDDALDSNWAETVKASWTGAHPRQFHETPISDKVVRLDYDAPGARSVELDPTGYQPWSLAINPSWRPAEAAPRVLQYWHHLKSWTGSSADSVVLQIDQPTAALRVHWTFGQETHDWILPARTDDGMRSILELGKIDCGGTTIPPEQLKRGGELTVTAIRFDGSEVAVTGVPKHLITSEMPESDEGLLHAFALTVPVAAPSPPATSTSLKESAPETNTLGMLVVACALLGTLIALRTRVRTPTNVG